MSKPQIVEYIAESVDYSIFDVKWVPNSAKFVSIGANANGTGTIQVFEMSQNKVVEVAKIDRPKALKCSSFGVSELGNSRVAVGDFSGGLYVIDLDHPLNPVYSVPEAHNDIINTMDAFGGVPMNCGAPEIVTGSRDGVVKVWDVRQNGAPVACISAATGANGGTGGRDCWAVTFGNSYNNHERVVAAGYDNGDLKVFDLRQMSVLVETNLKNGVCGLEFDRKDIQMNKLCAVTLEGGLHVFDTRTVHPKKGFASVTEKGAGKALGTNGVIAGGRSTMWAVKHLPQNRDVFITCSGSGSVRLWQYEYPSKRSRPGPGGSEIGIAGSLKMLKAATLSTQPINSLDWNVDLEGMAVCGSFDQTVRVLITTKLPK